MMNEYCLGADFILPPHLITSRNLPSGEIPNWARPPSLQVSGQLSLMAGPIISIIFFSQFGLSD